MPHKMLTTQMLHCAHDAEGTVGAALFEHSFTDGLCYSVHSSPVKSSRADLMTEQVFPGYSEAYSGYDKLLDLLSSQLGPMRRQEVPEGFNQAIHAAN
jgi:hypothetical protein